MADGKVVYEIVGDSSGLDNDLDHAEETIKTKTSAWEKVSSGALNRLGSAAMDMAMKAGQAAIDYGTAFEQSLANTSTLIDTDVTDMDALKGKMLDLSDSTGLAADELNKLTFIFYPANADTTLSVDLLAAKLELGSQQTLAHQGADGNWVLNEIPDYGEQLRRCQRYCYVMNHTSGHYAAGFGHTINTTLAQVFFSVPVKMRANPAISFTDGTAWSIKCNGATIIPTSISAWFASDYVIGIKVAGTFPGAFYPIEMTSNSGDNVIFSADL